MTLARISLVLVVALVGACASASKRSAAEQESAARAVLGERAAADLGCAVKDVEILSLGASTINEGLAFEARGCGQSARYTADCRSADQACTLTPVGGVEKVAAPAAAPAPATPETAPATTTTTTP